MTKRWKFCQELDKFTLLIQNYSLQDEGVVFQFSDYDMTTYLLIKFPVDVESVHIRHIPYSVACNDQVYEHMIASGCQNDAPMNPFFIQDGITPEELVTLWNIDTKRKSYHKYIMVTDDFWIEVISSVPPKIEISKGTA